MNILIEMTFTSKNIEISYFLLYKDFDHLTLLEDIDMPMTAMDGMQTSNHSGECCGGPEMPNSMAFNEAMMTAEEDGCCCEGMEENEAAEESEGAGCGEHLTVPERIDQLEARIAELEQSGNADPEELQALRKELLSLSDTEGNDEATTEQLGDLEERLDALTMQS